MLKKIEISQLRLGMYIHEFAGSWMDHPFWKGRFLLTRPEDLRAIRNSNLRELWIDASKGEDLAQTENSKTEQQVAAQTDALLCAALQTERVAKVELNDEINRALKICAKSKAAVVEMFTDARMGKAVAVDQVSSLIDEIAVSVQRHPGALISLARLKTADEYTYMHSVAVSALMIALAQELELPAELVKEAGIAGLLHDIGKMAIPDSILNKPGSLSEAEFNRVRSHPAAGHAMLLHNPLISPQVLDVCLSHHEKMDGSGYPNKTQGQDISLFARMGAVCDVYDAITSDRPYKKGWDPAESIRKMAEWQGHFDAQVFQAFVKCVGIYPCGALVRLESGRLAVVMEQSTKSLLTPVVKVFFSARSKVPIKQEIIDLSKVAGRDKIISREDPDNWNFKHLEALWSGLQSSKKSLFD
ncbi:MULTISPECIES: HD-GYP domain-containing protein [Pseudomonas]|uniref:HD-GYP domain-containing protein n=1 Tax=Pseudomonas TaxID=286 RepID=UPI0004975D1D|nr:MULTISPECIES: HD-GYP domain-containing protein [Pseudomonas]